MTLEEMRESPRYKEATEHLDNFMHRNNVAGYLNLCTELIDESSETDDKDLSAILQAVVEDNVNYFTNTTNEKHFNFFKDVVALSAQRRNANIIEVGKVYDEYEQQIKNGELEDMDTYSVSPEETQFVALRLTRQNNKVIKDSMNTSDVEAIFRSVLEEFPDDKGKEMLDHILDSNKKAREEITDEDEATKTRYNKINGTAIPEKLRVPTSLFPEDPYLSAEKLPKGQHGFTDHPGYVKFFKTATDEELDALMTETKQNLQKSIAFETASKEWANTANELAQQIERETPEEKRDEKYNELQRALKNASKLGTCIDGDVMEDVRMRSSYFGYTDDAAQFTLKDVTQAADGFSDKELAEKIKKAAVSAKEKIDAAYEPIKPLHERSRKARFVDRNINTVQSGHIALDVKRIEVEQQRRIVMKDPAASAEITAKQAEIRNVNEMQEDIALIKQSIRLLKSDVTQSAEKLDKDRESRNIPDKNRKKHKEYFDLTEKAQELKNLQAEDLTPQQLMEKLTEAKRTADTYVDTHAGPGNLFSGWTEEGRTRIAHARRISSHLEKRMKQLQPLVEKLQPKFEEGKTIGQKRTELDDTKKTLRTEIAERKREVIERYELEQNVVENKSRLDSSFRSMTDDDIERTHPDAEKMIGQHRQEKERTIQEITKKMNRTIPENEDFSADGVIKAGQEQLKNAKSALPEGSYPDKSEMEETYVSIIAGQTLKMGSGERYAEGLPENIGKLFDGLKNALREQDVFREMLASGSSQELYEHATMDNGQELWDDYFTAGMVLKNTAAQKEALEQQKNIEKTVNDITV